jgi:diguanylate cyclase (GGDEF)-like protein/PAS domain S-box-containing protein
MLDLQNAEIFRAVLDTLPAGVCLVDRDRSICFWNDGAEKITGFLRHDVLGRFSSEVLMINFQENKAAVREHSCPLAAAMRDGKAREWRVYLHHKSGYAIPVTLRAAPIRDAQSHVIGAVENFVERPSVPTWRRPESDLAVAPGLDAVTQLPDYPFTESYLVDRLKFASEHAIPFGLLCIGLDQLETLKASHGLDAAETVLNVVAHTLRNGLDPLDFVGRWSEDQFLAVVANCRDSDMLSTAERLKQLAQSSEIVWWGDPLKVTVSVGGTALRSGEPLEPLLDRALSALKQAVAEGGNSAIVACVSETP